MTSPTAPTRCAICGSADLSILYECALDYITFDEFRVYECGACGVAFTHPTPQNIGRYYPSRYRAYSPVVLGTLKALYRRKARKWAAAFANPGRVLEVGCGPGLMLDALRQRGWDALGLERSEDAAAFGRREFGLDIRSCGVEELAAEPVFDLIILFQVLEHMVDPAAIVSECVRRLKPGGRMVISVPNIESWQARAGGTRWMHLDIPRHLFHFSARSLTAVLCRNGFKNITVGFTSFEHDPIGWVQTLINRVVSPPNTLLRYLMKLDAPPEKAAISLILSAVLVLPSVGMSLVSWTVGRGAILLVEASIGTPQRPEKAEQLRR